MIEVRPLHDSVQLVVVAGCADLGACRTLQQTAFANVRQGCTRFVLDLTGVDEVRPGVLGALLRLRRQLLAVGGGLSVVSDRTAADLFSTSVPDIVLARAASVEEAVGLLAPS